MIYMILFKINLYLVYYPTLGILLTANYISKKLRHKQLKIFDPTRQEERRKEDRKRNDY